MIAITGMNCLKMMCGMYVCTYIYIYVYIYMRVCVFYMYLCI